MQSGNRLNIGIEVWDSDRGADDILGRGSVVLGPDSPTSTVRVPLRTVKLRSHCAIVRI